MNSDSITKHIESHIDKSQVLHLSELNSYKSVASLILEWLIIIFIVFINQNYWNIALYVVSVILIAARMHAIGTHAHEATHYMLIKNKKLNDLVTELFVTWPLFYSFKEYRKLHLAHHRFLNGDKDPDVGKHKKYKEFQFPLKKVQMFWIIIKDISGINFIIYKGKMILNINYWKNLYNNLNLTVILYYGILLSMIYLSGGSKIFIMYWIIPFITWLQFIQRVRAIAEHNAIPEDKMMGTRTTLTSWFDRLLFGPKNTNFHTEHHIFPSVPFFNLPKLHRVLKSDYEFKKHTHFTHSYFNVLKECIS